MSSLAPLRLYGKAQGGTKKGYRLSRAVLLGLQALYQIAGDRPADVEPPLRSLLDGIGGHGVKVIGPRADLIHGFPGRQTGAVPARQRRLVVLGISRAC